MKVLMKLLSQTNVYNFWILKPEKGGSGPNVLLHVAGDPPLVLNLLALELAR